MRGTERTSRMPGDASPTETRPSRANVRVAEMVIAVWTGVCAAMQSGQCAASGLPAVCTCASSSVMKMTSMQQSASTRSRPNLERVFTRGLICCRQTFAVRLLRRV
jgi:hypothetical protein